MVFTLQFMGRIRNIKDLKERSIARACNSQSDSIDSEIKIVTKNSQTKTWACSLLDKYTKNLQIYYNITRTEDCMCATLGNTSFNWTSN